MKQIKILFQGDSITDAGRDKRNYFDLGAGYPKYAAEQIKTDFPDTEFVFTNFGISGNRTCQLFDRLYKDGIELQPDVISILIGINDVWHRHSHGREMTDEQFEANYRAVLERIRRETHAKILMLCPFLLPSSDKESWRDEVERIATIVRRLADEYADAYLPLDEKFAEALPTAPTPMHYSLDGVHPNAAGAEFIGGLYREAILPLLS